MFVAMRVKKLRTHIKGQAHIKPRLGLTDTFNGETSLTLHFSPRLGLIHRPLEFQWTILQNYLCHNVRNYTQFRYSNTKTVWFSVHLTDKAQHSVTQRGLF